VLFHIPRHRYRRRIPAGQIRAPKSRVHRYRRILDQVAGEGYIHRDMSYRSLHHHLQILLLLQVPARLQVQVQVILGLLLLLFPLLLLLPLLLPAVGAHKQTRIVLLT
jgi:hypothetical protein